MTIRNPIEWAGRICTMPRWPSARPAGGRRVMSAAGAPPAVRRITNRGHSRRAGARIDDFGAHRHRCHLLALIYPLAACCWRGSAFGYDMLRLLFPLHRLRADRPVAASGCTR